MAIDLQNSLTFRQLATRLSSCSDATPVHPSTVHRWRLRGIDGTRLEAVKIGGRWYTSWPALESFAATLTAKKNDPTRVSSQAAADAQVQLENSKW
ncbi:hypothetical protein Q31b_57460 [Novipirellula aureliae]|uniref:DUF1580 domain-containing protein n=1 Tax=Novipirellula aureliae TaxID=2527966 RepID=A0A5C6DER5_9BACT|nr:DUF1580 domain-containing protein [Novipirellula aureliae]TWU33429.1 hypothetical protein Q31b_57460 [Novipirellula aureliae]